MQPMAGETVFRDAVAADLVRAAVVERGYRLGVRVESTDEVLAEVPAA